MPIHTSARKLFGQNVRTARESQELTQEGLAELANLDRTYISDIERGLRNPSLDNIVKLAVALRQSASELMKGV
jgi:transcriptional regulator with XRE-family HTH domain